MKSNYFPRICKYNHITAIYISEMRAQADLQVDEYVFQ